MSPDEISQPFGVSRLHAVTPPTQISCQPDCNFDYPRHPVASSAFPPSAPYDTYGAPPHNGFQASNVIDDDRLATSAEGSRDFQGCRGIDRSFAAGVHVVSAGAFCPSQTMQPGFFQLGTFIPASHYPHALSASALDADAALSALLTSSSAQFGVQEAPGFPSSLAARVHTPSHVDSVMPHGFANVHYGYRLTVGSY